MSKRAAEDIIGDAEKKICTEEAKAENGNHGVADEAKAVDAKVEITLSNKPTLYHSPHYSSTRPLIVIEELGLKDKINVKMCLDKEHKKPEFIAINAHGTLPVYTTEDGEHVLESGAIAWYLTEKFGGKDHALFGKPEQRAKLLQWMFYSPATFYPSIAAAYAEPALSNAEEKAKLKKRVNETVLVQLARELGDKKYLLGDEFTLADIAIGYELVGAHHLGWLGSDFPTLQAYMSRLMERESFKRTLA